MTPLSRNIAVLVFFLTAVWLIALPELRQDSVPVARPAATPSASPTKPSAPSSVPSTPDGESTLAFVNPLPRRCRSPRLGPPDGGTLAVIAGGRLRFWSESGTPLGSAGSFEAPVRWSADGRALLDARGRVFGRDGSPRGRIFSGPPTGSPVWLGASICALALTPDGLVAGSAGADEVVLLEDPALASSGGSVNADSSGGFALVVTSRTKDLALYVDLQKGRARPLRDLPRLRKPVIAGWVGNAAVWWPDPRRPERLLVSSPVGRTERIQGAVKPGSIRSCAGDLLGLSPGGAIVAVGRDSIRRITTESSYVDFTCAAERGFIAAVDSGGRLALLDGSGRFLRHLAPPSDGRDAAPLWGPPGAGLYFVRYPVGGAAGEIWHAAEGEVPRSTGIAVDAGGHAAFTWSRALD